MPVRGIWWLRVLSSTTAAEMPATTACMLVAVAASLTTSMPTIAMLALAVVALIVLIVLIVPFVGVLAARRAALTGMGIRLRGGGWRVDRLHDRLVRDLHAHTLAERPLHLPALLVMCHR